jgi:hypothetical protein
VSRAVPVFSTGQTVQLLVEQALEGRRHTVPPGTLAVVAEVLREATLTRPQYLRCLALGKHGNVVGNIFAPANQLAPDSPLKYLGRQLG